MSSSNPRPHMVMFDGLVARMDALRAGLAQLDEMAGTMNVRRARGANHGGLSGAGAADEAARELATLRRDMHELRGLQDRRGEALARAAEESARTADAADGLGRSCYLMRRELREMRAAGTAGQSESMGSLPRIPAGRRVRVTTSTSSSTPRRAAIDRRRAGRMNREDVGTTDDDDDDDVDATNGFFHPSLVRASRGDWDIDAIAGGFDINAGLAPGDALRAAIDASERLRESEGPERRPWLGRSITGSLPEVRIRARSSKSSSSSSASPSCAICLEDFAPLSMATALPCAHLFHRGCIREWLSLRQSCPLCKREVGLADAKRGAKNDIHHGNNINYSAAVADHRNAVRERHRRAAAAGVTGFGRAAVLSRPHAGNAPPVRPLTEEECRAARERHLARARQGGGP